jgi:SAM-dependent methyltransferase
MLLIGRAPGGGWHRQPDGGALLVKPEEDDMTDIATIDDTMEETSAAADREEGGLTGRLFEAGLGAIELLSVYLGVRLSLYESLRSAVATAPELAARAGIDERYAREWLEQQTVAGILTCDNRDAAPDHRRFALPAHHAVALLDADHPSCIAPIALALVSVANVMPELLDAYRSGGGVPYAHYGTDFRHAQGGFNRPAFVHLLTADWIPNGVPDVHARLQLLGARVADVACGVGWSSIALASAYPGLMVDGFDLDDASIADARRHAASANVSDRVTFEVRDGMTLGVGQERGRYDLVCIFEAVHDVPNPVEVLRAARAMCKESGTVLVMDERTADSFAESDGPIERFLYGASVLHCLPVGRIEDSSAATGAVMRRSTLHEYANGAGFSSVEVLPLEHDLFRFYHLTP